MPPKFPTRWSVCLAGIWQIAVPGVEAKPSVFVNPTTVDFGPVATKVISENPEVVDMNYLGIIPSSVGQMYTALRENGYKGIILPGIISQMDIDNITKAAGATAEWNDQPR